MTYPYRVEAPWVAWACDEFGNDTVGNRIWEKSISVYDLIKGDGATAGTFPTFTTDVPGVSYYTFDGVDDYISNWPTMPATYTVSAAMSDSYPDGQPYIVQCNDDTIENLLTVGGAFTGNLHNLVIFDSILSVEEAQAWASFQLRRLWRETYINPYTARLIRADESIQEYVFTVSGDPYKDYSNLDVTATPSSITWEDGLIFNSLASVVTVPDETGLRLDEITIFVSGIFSSGTIVEKLNNYLVEFNSTSNSITLSINGISSGAISIPIAQVYSVGITATTGGYPNFYVNGRQRVTSGSTITLNSATSNVLNIGNLASPGITSAFTDVLKRLSICNRILNQPEMMMLHLATMVDFE